MPRNQSGGLSIRAQAKLLGISKSLMALDRSLGCPPDEEGGRRWRAARRRPYLRPGHNEVMESLSPDPDSDVSESRVEGTVPNLVALSSPPEEPPARVEGGGFKLLKAGEEDDLSAVVEWLRTLVKSYWAATTEAVERGDTARADALCRQLQSLTRNLASTEATWKKMQENYGGLVSRATMVRFWMLYKKSVDRCVLELPECAQREQLIDTLDRITIQFSADLKVGNLIA